MLRLTPAQAAQLTDWYAPLPPGPQVLGHAVCTGHGAVWADRWPAPRALLADVAGNYALAGDPAALSAAGLPPLAGFVEAPPPLAPLLRAACPAAIEWARVIYALPGEPADPPPVAAAVRPLARGDAAQLAALSDESDWISKTWGGPAGLAASGLAWGAFVEGRLASVANAFFAGPRYVDLGVATEPEFRGRGFSPACAAALCRQVRAGGRQPCWSTSLDNPASQRVAEKLGFVFERHDVLYVTGVPLP